MGGILLVFKEVNFASFCTFTRKARK